MSTCARDQVPLPYHSLIWSRTAANVGSSTKISLCNAMGISIVQVPERMSAKQPS